jgi:hypothetical protein
VEETGVPEKTVLTKKKNQVDKLEAKLRAAGLHQSDYARQVMSKTQPLQPPRRDMESTVFKNT